MTTTTNATISRAYLTGNCYMVRKELTAGGWKFDGERKQFYKDRDWEDAAEAVGSARAVPGVRNRVKEIGAEIVALPQ